MRMDQELFPQTTARSGLVAWVAPERGVDLLEGLAYLVPEGCEPVRVGMRVRVPLGKGRARVPGWVVRVATEAEASADLAARGLDAPALKALEARDAGEGEDLQLSEAMIELARWMAGYYCCPLGMVLGTMTPASVKRGVGGRTVIRLRRVELEAAHLAEIRETLPPAAQRALDALEASGAGRAPAEPKRLARELGAHNLGPVNRLVEAGVLEEVRGAVVREFGERIESAAEQDAAPEPTGAQRRAVEAIGAGPGGFAAYLLHGVTGSGKTEVYLRVLEEVVGRGACGIVLVPEISLTPQTAGRFVGRFRDRGVEVAVLHSGLSPSQRHAAWARVASGAARIVVGARSAVFAPFDQEKGAPLGVIIVDEEHDGSYKQDQLPRYHARDVALKRGQLEGCPVVLGSATPSLESWRNALGAELGGAGRFGLLSLPERVGGGVLPRVRVVDLADERRAEPERSRELRSIGPTLRNALAETLARPGAQAILLLNRRGYASYVCCADATCGWFMTCEHCDVTVVHHRRSGSRRGLVRCHHCLAEQRLPETCPRCAKSVNTFGFGTQRVEEELERLSPDLRSGDTLLRVDADTMRRAADFFGALERFRTGGARVLLGTQMVAKGLDFPGVELIGVINADTAINLPDFRAAERTFQLVAQVAGRAGRSERSSASSRVIVQTMNPHEPAIEMAARHDYIAFATQELEVRAGAGLPPAWRMARVVCRDEDHAKAEARASEVARRAREVGERVLRVKGPMPCAISRIAGQHRWGVELLGPDAGVIQRALAALRSARLVRSDAKTAVDVDPAALL